MKLSVNLNKIALLRNARGENYPDLHYFANKAIDLGVDGLTLHPRPDHRHATSNDVIELAKRFFGLFITYTYQYQIN